MKKFSIGSKKPDAKQININLNPKHLWFGGVIFLIVLLFHTFVYSPYLKTDYKITCFDGTEVEIVDNLQQVCDWKLSVNMSRKEIVNYILVQQKDTEFILTPIT